MLTVLLTGEQPSSSSAGWLDPTGQHHQLPARQGACRVGASAVSLQSPVTQQLWLLHARTHVQNQQPNVMHCPQD